MATPLLHTPVLPGNPTTDEHILALLMEMSQQIGVLQTVTIGAIPVQSTKVQELRGTYLALNRAIRCKLRFAA